MAVQTFNPTDLSQSATNWAVAQRIVGPFAPHAQVTPNLTLALDPGFLLSGTTLTEVNAQNVGPFAPPSSGFRIDRVVIDRSTGAASIVTGAANSLTPPAIPTGKLPIARVMLQATTDAITNAVIVDERALFDLTPDSAGGAFYAHKNGTNQTIPSASWIKVTFGTVSFNTGSGFDTGNSFFKPSVPGFYRISAALNVSGIPDNTMIGVGLAKNGTLTDRTFMPVRAAAGNTNGTISVDSILDLNGSSDYVEIQGYQGNTSSATITGAVGSTWVTGNRIG
jgi:hypothetical protein